MDDAGSQIHPAHLPDPETSQFTIFAEGFAHFLGTPRFIVGQTIVVVLWIILNLIAWAGSWDPYPFILLNLAFSTQAAYAAPLILLSQTRQEKRDRKQAGLDYLNGQETLARDRHIHAHSKALTDYFGIEVPNEPPSLDIDEHEVQAGPDEITAPPVP